MIAPIRGPLIAVGLIAPWILPRGVVARTSRLLDVLDFLNQYGRIEESGDIIKIVHTAPTEREKTEI